MDERELGSVVIEKAGKYPKHYIILASYLGDLKRTKKVLLEWEARQLREGILKYCFALKNDWVVVEAESGQKFRIRASKIPEEYVSTQILNVIDESHTNKVCNPKITVKKIYVKSQKKPKINYEGDSYETTKICN